jgi:hypothetical protein
MNNPMSIRGELVEPWTQHPSILRQAQDERIWQTL